MVMRKNSNTVDAEIKKFNKLCKTINEDEASQPTEHNPGSTEKVALLARRYELGIFLHDDKDVNQILEATEGRVSTPTLHCKSLYIEGRKAKLLTD